MTRSYRHQQSTPPINCPTLQERGILVERRCTWCRCVHLALYFAPLAAPCLSCVNAAKRDGAR